MIRRAPGVFGPERWATMWNDDRQISIVAGPGLPDVPVQRARP